MGLPQRVIVLLEPGFLGVPLVGRAAALDVDRLVQIHPEAVRALDPEAQGIGARQAGVVLQQDGLAVGAGDGGGDHVAQLELDRRIGVIGPAGLDDVVVQAARLGRVAGQIDHPVAPVQVDVVGDRADAVGGIELAVAVDRVPGAPARLGPALGPELDAAAIGLLRVAAVELHRAQVVLIAALQVNQLAEQTGPHHVQRRQDVAAIADVLQHHIGRAGALMDLDQVPVVLQRHPGDDLAGDGDFRLHGGDGHGGVPFPGRGDDHGVQAGMGQQVQIGPVGRAFVGAGRRTAGGGDHALGAGDHQGLDVADGDDVHVVALQQDGQQGLGPQADADDPDLQPVGAAARPGQGGRGQGRGGGGGRGGDEGAAIHEGSVGQQLIRLRR